MQFVPRTLTRTYGTLSSSLLSSLQLWRTVHDPEDGVDEFADDCWLCGRCGRFSQNTQIYEGANQIQRVVIAKHLLK